MNSSQEQKEVNQIKGNRDEKDIKDEVKGNNQNSKLISTSYTFNNYNRNSINTNSNSNNNVNNNNINNFNKLKMIQKQNNSSNNKLPYSMSIKSLTTNYQKPSLSLSLNSNNNFNNYNNYNNNNTPITINSSNTRIIPSPNNNTNNNANNSSNIINNKFNFNKKMKPCKVLCDNNLFVTNSESKEFFNQQQFTNGDNCITPKSNLSKLIPRDLMNKIEESSPFKSLQSGEIVNISSKELTYYEESYLNDRLSNHNLNIGRKNSSGSITDFQGAISSLQYRKSNSNRKNQYSDKSQVEIEDISRKLNNIPSLYKLNSRDSDSASDNFKNTFNSLSSLNNNNTNANNTNNNNLYNTGNSNYGNNNTGNSYVNISNCNLNKNSSESKGSGNTVNNNSSNSNNITNNNNNLNTANTELYEIEEIIKEKELEEGNNHSNYNSNSNKTNIISNNNNNINNNTNNNFNDSLNIPLDNNFMNQVDNNINSNNNINNQLGNNNNNINNNLNNYLYHLKQVQLYQQIYYKDLLNNNSNSNSNSNNNNSNINLFPLNITNNANMNINTNSNIINNTNSTNNINNINNTSSIQYINEDKENNHSPQVNTLNLPINNNSVNNNYNTNSNSINNNVDNCVSKSISRKSSVGKKQNNQSIYEENETNFTLAFMYGKSGWICHSCRNFNFESKYIS